MFSNRFSSEFLVPSDDFEKYLKKGTSDDTFVNDLANIYKVSREVILRKFLNKKLITKEYYNIKTEQLLKEYEKNVSTKKGGNYYATQVTYLGENFLTLAFTKYYQGFCTIGQLADYLNVRVKSIAGLEQFMLKKVSSL